MSIHNEGGASYYRDSLQSVDGGNSTHVAIHCLGLIAHLGLVVLCLGLIAHDTLVDGVAGK